MCPFYFLCDIFEKNKILKKANKELSNTIKRMRLDLKSYEDILEKDYFEVDSFKKENDSLKNEVEYLKNQKNILLFQHKNKDIFNSIHDKYNKRFRIVVKKILFESSMDEKTKHDLIKSICEIEQDYFGDAEDNTDEIIKEFRSIKKELYERDLRFKELWEKIDSSRFCSLGTTPYYPAKG